MKVKETMAYHKFCVHPVNRNVGDTSKLEESFLKYGWLDWMPIYCVPNGEDKYVIVSGHHRFVVARKLNIPIKYIVSDKKIDIYELEATTKKWVLSDYITSFVKAGNTEYEKMYEYWKRTGISLTCCLSIFTGIESAPGSDLIKKFISGNFKINEQNMSKNVELIVNECRLVGFKDSSTRSFILALLKIFPNENFNIYRFIKKIKAHSWMLKKKPSQIEYIELIEAIYNRKSIKKISLTFEAEAKIKG